MHYELCIMHLLALNDFCLLTFLILNSALFCPADLIYIASQIIKLIFENEG